MALIIAISRFLKIIIVVVIPTTIIKASIITRETINVLN